MYVKSKGRLDNPVDLGRELPIREEKIQSVCLIFLA